MKLYRKKTLLRYEQQKKSIKSATKNIYYTYRKT